MPALIGKCRRALSQLHNQNYFPINAATWFLCLLQIIMLIEMSKDNFFLTYGNAFWVYVVCLSFIPAFVVPACISVFLRKYPKPQQITYIICVGLMLLISLISNRMHFPLSYSWIAENYNEIIRPESVRLIFDHILIGHWIGLSLLLIGLCYMVFKTQILIHPTTKEVYGYQFWLMPCLLILMFVLPVYRANDTLYFARSVIDYYNDPFSRVEIAESEYPYVNEGVEHNSGNSNLPNVFIIAVESFNFHYLDGKDPTTGRPYMPFLQSFRKDCLEASNFYGNSIQTCRGHLSMMASVLPSVRGKTFHNWEDLRVRMLSHVFQDRDYATVFWNAADNNHFDNTKNFMLKHGFEHVHAMNKKMAKDIDSAYLWKWGARDKYAYDRFLRYVDEHCADKKVFSLIASISSHYPFDHMPADQRFIYKKPSTIQEHMANSMYLVDQDLKFLVEQIRSRERYQNSLIVITGDHGYPTAEHGIEISGNGYYEEFFKVPFLLNWPKHVEPKIIDDYFSQIDLAPTICELLGFKESNHFLGHSMLHGENPNPVWLIQPYAGTYLISIDDAQKYVYHLQSGEELLYDLQQDPDEEYDLFDAQDPSRQERLRKSIEPIYLNQYLLRNDQIWPR